MSLPVGGFSWRNRIVYPGDEAMRPYDLARPTAQNKTSSSSAADGTLRPSTYRAADDLPSSLYTEDFRAPPGWQPTTQLEQTARLLQGGARSRNATKHQSLSLGAGAKGPSIIPTDGLTHEQRSSELWGRVNPSFFPLELTTESGANYVPHHAQGPVDRAHHLKSCSLPAAVKTAKTGGAFAAGKAAQK